MTSCRWTQQVEAYFDGEAASGVEAHLDGCAVCAGHLDMLRAQREAVAGAQERATIQDAQFSAFMDGIREGLEAPRRRHTGFWAMASMAAAAMLVVLGTMYVFSGGPETVKATEVEFVSTDLEGAAVDWYNTEDGVTSIRLTQIKDME